MAINSLYYYQIPEFPGPYLLPPPQLPLYTNRIITRYTACSTTSIR
jgi:hypothetical protein